MFKRRLDITVYVPDGKYCNVDSKESCRFCVKHCNGHTCALSQNQLQYDGKMIIKDQECMWASRTTTYTEPDVTINTKHLIKDVVDTFVKTYKALRKAGFSEDMSLSTAKKEVTK